jgi:tripartite-type tricarboxylate transporter receptor subunit TctC
MRLPAVCLAAAVLAALGSPPLTAQDFPTRPVTIVVPLAAGTGLDVIARLYGEKLSHSLGKPVVIENRPGAGMIPATQAALAAPPDGHTLLVATSSTLSINQTLFKQLPYDPEKDLTPVAHYITAPFILALNPGLPPKTVPEFIAYAKQQAAPLNYSSPAGGGVAHFAVELMRHRFDLKFTHVPYKNSPQSIMDIAAGHVHFAFAESGASLPLIRDGKLRALAVSSSQRLPARSEIPTFAEASGARDYESVAWHILVVNAKTPRPIVERLHAEMKTIMAAPEMRQRISNMGLIPVDPPPIAETERYIKSETVKWRGVLTNIGLAGTQ